MADDTLRVGKEKQDPITDGAASGRALFEAFRQTAVGFPFDACLDAAGNIIMNSLRQEHASWANCEKAFDEQFGRMKQMMKNHYDSTTGRRKSVFPFNQVIQAAYFDARKGRRTK